jgi:DHA3 family tetracycline resistance protein-like MFS transporter
MDDRISELSGRKRSAWQRVGVLRPLVLRDFRLLWTGRSISLLGDGIFKVAVPWQVLQISNSPSALAVIGVAWTVPLLAFVLLGGVVSDRFDRRRVMLTADVLRGLAVGGLGAISLSGGMQLWHVLVLSVVFGTGEALFYPAFGAVVPELVPKELLVQANSLDGFVRPLAEQMLGPAIGGVAIEVLSVGGAFLLDAGSFVCSIVALLLMHPRPRERAAFTAEAVLGDIREGVQFVRSQTWLWGTLVAAAVSLLVFLGPWEVLLPFVVKNDLQESAGALGLVYAVGGAGAVLAAVIMGQRELPKRVITFIYATWAIGIAGLVVYGIATALWQLVIASFLSAGLNTMGEIAWLTLVQRAVPERLLGRVTSLDWLVSTSLLPISFALTGPVAAALGVRATLIGAGVLGAVVTAAFFFLLPGLRDIERRRTPQAPAAHAPAGR